MKYILIVLLIAVALCISPLALIGFLVFQSFKFLKFFLKSFILEGFEVSCDAFVKLCRGYEKKQQIGSTYADFMRDRLRFDEKQNKVVRDGYDITKQN